MFPMIPKRQKHIVYNIAGNFLIADITVYEPHQILEILIKKILKTLITKDFFFHLPQRKLPN